MDKREKNPILQVIEILEETGFYVSEAREERDLYGDSKIGAPTGAILLRITPKKQSD
jgi:predicted Zn-dependent peptidase